MKIDIEKINKEPNFSLIYGDNSWCVGNLSDTPLEDLPKFYNHDEALIYAKWLVKKYNTKCYVHSKNGTVNFVIRTEEDE